MAGALRRAVPAGLIGAAALLAALDAGAAGTGDAAAGRALYETGCASCHGLEGEGTSRGPALEEVGEAGAHFVLSTGRMPLDQASAQAVRKPPAYSPEQIADLVAYLGVLSPGPAIPQVDPDDGDLPEGQQLYAANCAGCHNSAGSGGALGQAIYAPRLTEATPTQVAEAVRIGPGAMPVFGPGVLDDAELASVVRYVEYLKDPHDRGGASLGRLGPVPEGMVAWFVGLGAVLGAVWWIGTRT